MQRIARPDLPRSTAHALQAEQQTLDNKRRDAVVDATAEWDRARKRQVVRKVRGVLRRMAGERERCMYCLDSHATDIEHFWPKSGFPERMFRWENLLLACTECGRCKGHRFPLDQEGRPLPLDPTTDQPWDHLDFDPDTGSLTAAYLPADQEFAERGELTVRVLQLDAREALQRGYRRTFLRLAGIVDAELRSGARDVARLFDCLLDADDHGLLEWCFSARGGRVPPFSELRSAHPDLFAECARRASTSQ